MKYCLGKLPARPGSASFKFGTFFNAAALPTPPLKFGHENIGRPFGMLANDAHQCCVFSGAAHETMVWGYESGNNVIFLDKDVLSDYSAVAGYDPNKPETDQGTDMTEAASYRRKTGVLDAQGVRHKIDSYVSLKPGDTQELAIATYIMGGVGVGLKFTEKAMEQFDAETPWDFIPGAKSIGGHYVNCLGRNSHGNFLIVSWGRLHAMTPRYYFEMCDEALCYISLEAIGAKGLTPEGFNIEQLRHALGQLAS